MAKDPLSFKVSTTLTANRVVTCLTGTAETVKYPASVAECPIGITTDDVKDTSTSIPVAVDGFAWLYFNDTCTSGALVEADSAGRGVPKAASTTTAFHVGKLVGPSVSATGTIARVLIQPGVNATA